MNKRKFSSTFEDAPKLRLKLASTAEPAAAPLAADRQVLCLLSGAARGLPDADEWDLSGLLVDGQPVSRQTVIAWLNAAYQAAYKVDSTRPARTMDSTRPARTAAAGAGDEWVWLLLQQARSDSASDVPGRHQQAWCQRRRCSSSNQCRGAAGLQAAGGSTDRAAAVAGTQAAAAATAAASEQACTGARRVCWFTAA